MDLVSGHMIIWNNRASLSVINSPAFVQQIHHGTKSKGMFFLEGIIMARIVLKYSKGTLSPFIGLHQHTDITLMSFRCSSRLAISLLIER